MRYWGECDRQGNHGCDYTKPDRNAHGCYWFDGPWGGTEWQQGVWVLPVEGALMPGASGRVWWCGYESMAWGESAEGNDCERSHDKWETQEKWHCGWRSITPFGAIDRRMAANPPVID